MVDAIPEMIDAVFDVKGDALPANYSFALWHALLRHAPELATDLSVGVVPLKHAPSDANILLVKRAKLSLRIPPALAELAQALVGQQLDIDGSSLHLGSLKLREIQSYPTLHAHLVTSEHDEVQFLENVSAQLAELQITAKLICGMRNTMQTSDHLIQGFSLVIHDLKPDASLRLQYAGLGADRRYGCGIFIPYKNITDLD